MRAAAIAASHPAMPGPHHHHLEFFRKRHYSPVFYVRISGVHTP